MLSTIAFPKTYGVRNFPMMARYHLKRWKKGDYLHLTENDWRNCTSPIFISQTEADEWMRSATGQVHDLSRDRRRETRSDLSADHSMRPRARRGDRLPNPPSRNLRGSSLPESYDVSMNRVISSKVPPNSGGLCGSSAFLGPSSHTTVGGLFQTRVLDSVEQPLTLNRGGSAK